MHTNKKRFIELFKTSGWSQAECARQLAISSNYIWMIVHKDAVPSKMLLELLRIKVSLAGKEAQWLIGLLEGVPQDKRKDVLQICKTIVDGYHERATRAGLLLSS